MHIRSDDLELIFWVDALCINQQDVHECGHKVSLMRNIYMVADYVLLWLGTATEGLDQDDKRDLRSMGTSFHNYTGLGYGSSENLFSGAEWYCNAGISAVIETSLMRNFQVTSGKVEPRCTASLT
ncbi:hypothetical protein CC86DRAFT_353473 [Ophiobolus disseminans]|uniref:Heterokaryon incompatibility domain-containing protein n=1 Tax=Ophiobolus disseminans TaxID=1469910 RepID=A0A6A6ZVI3_9PLEO|nr:hypothetical protein CC86DRAFT_353473 [Ophiobolus disseminans]